MNSTNQNTSSKAQNGKKKGAVNTSTSGKSKGGKDSSADPTSAQVNAMVEELMLKESIGVDVVLDTDIYGDDLTDESAGGEGSVAVSRAVAAELEKRRKERDHERRMRADAVFYIEQALESGRDRDIRESIKYAKQAGLQGKLPNGQSFCTAALYKVCLCLL